MAPDAMSFNPQKHSNLSSFVYEEPSPAGAFPKYGEMPRQQQINYYMRTMPIPHTAIVEVCSDSLNTKSEDKNRQSVKSDTHS